jgi:polysaccharide export outer membrane protein
MLPLLVALIVAFAPMVSAAETPTYDAEAAAPTSAPTAGAYLVGPRDKLQILVYGEAELSQDVVQVDENGTINLPLLESVHVAGLTVEAIAQDLDRRFQEGGFLIHPHTTVSVSEYLSQEVEVIGAVPKPGLYYLQGPTTLSGMLARAGWINASTANGQATVRHGDGTSDVVDLSSMTQVGGPNPVLRQGDQVSIGEGQVVFVNGEVGKAGKYPYQKGLTAGQAVSLAGGGSPIARLAGTYVIRGEEKIPVNLKRIYRGRDSDVVLEAGDQIFVPESPL